MGCKTSSSSCTCNAIGMGDVVQLKSGGPKMTVNSVTQHGIGCTWFVEAGKEWTGPFQSNFGEKELKKCD